MIQKAKKRSLFLMGLFVGGIMAMIGNHMRSNYSSSDSLFVSVAHADVSSYSAAGDGCGGCCGCDSGDAGGGTGGGGTGGGGGVGSDSGGTGGDGAY